MAAFGMLNLHLSLHGPSMLMDIDYSIETPWLEHMSSPQRESNNAPLPAGADANAPTVAAFSPLTQLHSPSAAKQRSTILVQEKSPLLVATPPQITRALAYSHPFIVPLNRLVALLSWTTGDPWESFLLVAAFWAVTLYGDAVIRWAGPFLAVMGLIVAMYIRRFSPLSSSGWTGEKGPKGHKRTDSANMRHHKSLDEIVDELRLFTSRCNILLDPWLSLTEFLSTQVTATTATTKPALTNLFIRILVVTPIWILLTVRPIQIITSKRVIMVVGTISLTWHSRPAKVFRTVLWRSKSIRQICSAITGFTFAGSESDDESSSSNRKPSISRSGPTTAHEIAASLAKKRNADSPQIRFTFILYENQRRWLGIGWTSSMLAYERAAWTDDHMNTTPPKDRFELPEVDGGHARWRWVEGSEWHLEGVESSSEKDAKDDEDDEGWIYYDNKWHDGRRGKDGWGRYTRRRKWCRDAELVEITPSTEVTPSPTPKLQAESVVEAPGVDSDETEQANGKLGNSSAIDLKDDSSSSQSRKKYWFRRSSQPTSEKSTLNSSSSTRFDDAEDEVHTPFQQREQREIWGLGDDAQMELG